MSSDYEPAVFVSYAWGGESENIVDELEQASARRGIRIIRDKRELPYRGSIKEFEERIGQGQCIILIISDKYLRSEHCMYELLTAHENQNLRGRIFPVVLADAKIYSDVNRIDYIAYWDDEIRILNEALKSKVNIMANVSGLVASVDKFARIRASFDNLTNLLKDMNALTPEILKANGFSILIDSVKGVLVEKEKNGFQTQDNEIELEFSNQNTIRNSLKPPTADELLPKSDTIYALIVAPIQQGKTRVLKKLQETYEEEGWHTEFLDIQETNSDEFIAQLLDIKKISLASSSTLGEQGASFIMHCRQGLDREQPLAIFIDTRKVTLSQWRNLVDFLDGAWRRARDAFGRESLSKKYRVFIASRDTELTKVNPISITLVKHLPPLSYQDVSQAIEKALSNLHINVEEVKKSYSYDIFYLSSGHPGIIASIIKKFGESSVSTNLEYFLRKYREGNWKTDIRNYAEKAFRESIVSTINDPEELKSFAQKICVFRYFDTTIANTVLDNINQNKALDPYLSDLSFDVDKEGLYDGLYTDGVFRELIALDSLINDRELFSGQCLAAKKMCLEQIESPRYIQFINEYLFQSFQYLLAEQGGNINLWDRNTREEIILAFKNDFVEFLGKLKEMFPKLDRNDARRIMRNALQKALALHHIQASIDGERTIMSDEKLRSFRFIVNYIYKKENDEFESGWDVFEAEISNLISENMLLAGG